MLMTWRMVERFVRIQGSMTIDPLPQNKTPPLSFNLLQVEGYPKHVKEAKIDSPNLTLTSLPSSPAIFFFQALTTKMSLTATM